MGNFFGLFGNDDENIKKDETRAKNTDDKKLSLRREELDISKNRVQIGEVELSKEIVEEEKSVDVPVLHEEVVIERIPVNNEDSRSPITDEEIMRIPVSEEQVQVGKHTVVTEEIQAHKREVEETRHIEETLKKEKARINTEGNAKIIDEQNDENLQ